MNKSALLAEEIKEKEIEILQDRVNSNSKIINDLSNKLVADYCKQLDNYMRYIQERFQDTKRPLSVKELDKFCLDLPVYLYFSGEAQENLGIKADVAKAIKQEKYNEVYRQLGKGTISDKTSQAELAAQSEEITRVIYDRAYKIVKEKKDAAYELVGSIKKVMSRRIEESKISNIDDGRFEERRRL